MAAGAARAAKISVVCGPLGRMPAAIWLEKTR
jgi:hypothetical protein